MRQEDARGAEEVNPCVGLHEPQRSGKGQRLRHLRHDHSHLGDGDVLILPQDICHEYAEERRRERHGEGDDDAVEQGLPGLAPAEEGLVPPKGKPAPDIWQLTIVEGERHHETYGHVERHNEDPCIYAERRHSDRERMVLTTMYVARRDNAAKISDMTLPLKMSRALKYRSQT
jgi:hypothetical protein